MQKRQIRTPAELSNDDWNRIVLPFARSVYLEALQKLRLACNKPRRACDLFPPQQSNHGHDAINNIFRRDGIPFRFSRIESWVNESRPERMLAIIHWATRIPSGRQLPLPLVLPRSRKNRL